MPRIFDKYIPQEFNDPNDWLPGFPNPADFRFDYYKLLSYGTPIGQAPQGGVSVAVIGAGAAGMTAARELFRAGYNVTIYEASPRIGGRHHTVPVSGQSTGMELGAMRFPFFSDPGSQNSVTDYFFNAEAPGLTATFPNPGVAPGGTGIYVNQGFGPNDEFYPQPQMVMWPDNSTAPNDAYLSEVHTLVDNFITFFVNTVKGPYQTDEWPAMWRLISSQYDKMTVSDLVFAPAVTTYNDDGWLGGFGMTQEQSELFYVIGAGDGSWGPFFEIGAMWFIRCVIFGFNSNLQTVIGMNDAPGLPYYNDSSLTDSAGNPLPPPLYSGIQSLEEWLLYVTPPGASWSLYDACNDSMSGDSLFVNDAVQSITYNGNGVTVVDSTGNGTNFGYAVLTPQIWASQLGVALNNFTPDLLPQAVISARAEQHVIASCKVFFPLTEAYWNNPNCSIPQIIVSDTLVQDAYGLQWTPDDPGVLLASYTWEDDALKLLPYDDAQVAQMVLDQLDAITSSTLGETVSTYVDKGGAFVWQWSQQVGYSGCAKLYRQRNWSMNYALLAYNQQFSAQSRLYLAGETFSVEGGWSEPALRLALDAVIRIIQDSGGSFANGFEMNDYPLFDVGFQPDEGYNVSPNDA
jgi:monoamine oxidase